MIYFENTIHMLRELHIRLFGRCKKCGQKINPDKGYWTWENKSPIIGGYYHVECGMINNPPPKENIPF